MGVSEGPPGESRSPVEVISTALSNLYSGVLTTLTLKYAASVGNIDALLLAGCVISYAMLDVPYSESAAKYAETHAGKIRDAALALGGAEDTAVAFSYLYAAKAFHLVFLTGTPFSEEAIRLGKRATELSIYIPNTYDICGTDDGLTCIKTIANFALDYREEAFGRRS